MNCIGIKAKLSVSSNFSPVKGFQNKRLLHQHISFVHEKPGLKKGRLYGCFKCSSTFEMKYYLVEHLIEIHQEKEPYSCDNCSAKFSSHELKVKVLLRFEF